MSQFLFATPSGRVPARNLVGPSAPKRGKFDSKNFEFSLALGENQLPVRYEVNNGIAKTSDRRVGARMFALVETDVHVPEEMANYLAGYKPFGFCADMASKVVPVSKDEDFHRDFSAANVFRRVNVKAGPEGAIPEVDPLSTTTKYKTVDRLLGSFVSMVTEENASAHYRVRQVAARRIGNALALDREIDVFDGTVGLLGNPGNWNPANVLTLNAATQWDIGASADPLGDIDYIIGRATAQSVTEIWMPYDVTLVFIKHPSVRDHLRTALGDGAFSDMMKLSAGGAPANMSVDFMLPGYPIFRSVQSKVLNETTGALDYVLNKRVILVRSPPGVPQDGEDIATSYTFRVRGNMGVGYETREFRVENRGQKGGTMVVAYMSDVAQMTGNNIGGMINAVVS